MSHYACENFAFLYSDQEQSVSFIEMIITKITWAFCLPGPGELSQLVEYSIVLSKNQQNRRDIAPLRIQWAIEPYNLQSQYMVVILSLWQFK